LGQENESHLPRLVFAINLSAKPQQDDDATPSQPGGNGAVKRQTLRIPDNLNQRRVHASLAGWFSAKIRDPILAGGLGNMVPTKRIVCIVMRSSARSRRRTMTYPVLSLGLILLATGPTWAEDVLPEGMTARAWAIADDRTGELLWGLNEDKPAKAACTTKAMCAWVVLRLAEADPNVWDQTVRCLSV
jgi:hypothetical protein